MGPGQCPDTCELTCTAQTTTSSSLVAVPSTLTMASTLVMIKCTTHRCGTSVTQRSFLSFEIIVVNSELTIKFLHRNFLLKWLPTPTTTTLMPPFPSSQAQTFRSGNRRWGTSSSPNDSGASLPVLLEAHGLWRQSLGTPPQLKPSFKLLGTKIRSRCKA